MRKHIRLSGILLAAVAFGFGVIFSQITSGRQNSGPVYGTALPTNTEHPTIIAQAATETIPPNTPLATLTPSRTLRPPPTLEPPTPTVLPTLTATLTPLPTLDLSVEIPGLHGAETATPSSTPGCEPRKDWKLTYRIQRDDALARIADMYNTDVETLAEGNCLTDINLIIIGHELRVPGEAHPAQPDVVCEPFVLMTPINGTLAISGGGQLTFNWRGPRAPRNLIRIYRSNGSIALEIVLELRQNETIDLSEKLPEGGTFTWYVYPLDYYFVQTCPEGGPWTFTKEQYVPTPTPEIKVIG